MVVKVKRFMDVIGVKQIIRYGLCAVGTALVGYTVYQIGAQDGVRAAQQFVANNVDPETYKTLDDAYKNLMK